MWVDGKKKTSQVIHRPCRTSYFEDLSGDCTKGVKCCCNWKLLFLTLRLNLKPDSLSALVKSETFICLSGVSKLNPTNPGGVPIVSVLSAAY